MNTTNEVRQPGQGPASPTIYEFGPFVLDTLQHALLKDGKPVALTPKTYDTLLLLVQNHGRMMSKDQLMKALWPDSFVEEANVTQQVSMIRKALGEASSDPHYILTIPARGYRFVAAVQGRTDAKLVSDLPVPAKLPGAEVSQSAESARENEGSTPLASGQEGRRFQRAILIFAIAAGLSLAILAAIGECAIGIPAKGVVFDKLGNLYGATFNGGSDGYGTVFKMMP